MADQPSSEETSSPLRCSLSEAHCEGEQVLLGEADLDALERHRQGGIHARHHRRPELYGPLCDPAGQVHPDDANLP